MFSEGHLSTETIPVTLKMLLIISSETYWNVLFEVMQKKINVANKPREQTNAHNSDDIENTNVVD